MPTGLLGVGSTVASPQGNFRGPIFRQGRQHDDAAPAAGGYSAGDAPIDSYGAGAGAEEPLGNKGRLQ